MTSFPMYYLLIVMTIHRGSVTIPMESMRICSQQAEKLNRELVVSLATCIATHD